MSQMMNLDFNVKKKKFNIVQNSPYFRDWNRQNSSKTPKRPKFKPKQKMEGKCTGLSTKMDYSDHNETKFKTLVLG